MRVRLGTRASALALVQARAVAASLRDRGAEVELVTIRTSGDRLTQVALADFGGKGLFVKEIEEALLDGRVDLGVHSMKDLPAELPPGLCLAAFPAAEDPRDVLISRSGTDLTGLPPGAVVGTSSLRRRVLLMARRADLRVEPIRGNVDTRLRKLAEGQYDALVMAQAGLRRLGLAPAGLSALPTEEFLPAVGQGILALEAREDDAALRHLLETVDHPQTRVRAEAERAFLQRLGAGCHAAVAGLARLDGRILSMTGMVASPDGSTVLTQTVEGAAGDPAGVGRTLGDALLERGARTVLEPLS